MFQALTHSALGLEMGVAIAIGALIGTYLDSKLGTNPWMTLLWLGFGIAAAFKALFRVVKQAKREGAESNEQ